MSAPTSRKFGAVDVDRWRSLGLAGGRVLIGGVDITDRCTWFNDLNGLAECYLLDEFGHPYLLNGEPAREQLEGRVEVIPPEEIPADVNPA